jgi:hypothetical protein
MKKKIPLVEDNVELDLKIEVGRKIFNDHYIAGFVWRVTDDNGKNVLYMKNGEERYENFKLYKMIARTVHNHTSESQLDDSFFYQFKIDEKIEDTIDIDAMPCYA